MCKVKSWQGSGNPPLSGLVPFLFSIPSVFSFPPFSPGSLAHKTMGILSFWNILEGQRQAFMFLPRTGLLCHSASSHQVSTDNTFSPLLMLTTFHKITLLLYCPKWLCLPKVKREKNKRGKGEKTFHQIYHKKKNWALFYLRMKRKRWQMGEPLRKRWITSTKTDIPANSPSVKILAMFIGGQLQMCPSSFWKRKSQHCFLSNPPVRETMVPFGSVGSVPSQMMTSSRHLIFPPT